jgi:hypothetical protein
MFPTQKFVVFVALAVSLRLGADFARSLCIPHTYVAHCSISLGGCLITFRNFLSHDVLHDDFDGLLIMNILNVVLWYTRLVIDAPALLFCSRKE